MEETEAGGGMTTDLPARLARLRSLADGATPGPWHTDAYYIVGHVPCGRPGGEVIGDTMASVQRYNDGSRKFRDAAYIAAFHPDLTRALIDVALAAELTLVDIGTNEWGGAVQRLRTALAALAKTLEGGGG